MDLEGELEGQQLSPLEAPQSMEVTFSYLLTVLNWDSVSLKERTGAEFKEVKAYEFFLDMSELSEKKKRLFYRVRAL